MNSATLKPRKAAPAVVADTTEEGALGVSTIDQSLVALVGFADGLAILGKRRVLGCVSKGDFCQVAFERLRPRTPALVMAVPQ